MSFFKIIIYFTFIVLLNWKAHSELSCEDTYKDPDSFALAVTENLQLQRTQKDLWRLYQKLYFGDPKTAIKGSFNDVTKILERHPELSKLY